ncbi:MAG: hypothetical protein RL291_231, partial [Pseudomonadota bacterium]
MLPSVRLFSVLSVAAVASTLAISSPVEAQGANAFSGMAGAWSGNGQVRLAGGRTEQLKCTAYYTERSGGSGLGLAIRCANASSKIEMRANLTNANGRISGTWEERQY